MQGQDVIFSSEKDTWETPQWFFDLLNEAFHFDLDACANAHNAKVVPAYYTLQDNSLKQDWTKFAHEWNEFNNGHTDGFEMLEVKTVWMNPPYGRKKGEEPGIGAWLEKAYLTSLQGVTVVCLVPAKPETNWWWDWCLKAYEIRFVKGRLHFTDENGKTGAAAFPSAVVIFRNPRPPLPYINWWDPRK